MNPGNRDDEALLLEHALALPPNALCYHLGRVLEAKAGSRAIVEVMDSELDWSAFEREHGVSLEPVGTVHQEIGVRWSKPGHVAPVWGTTWHELSWRGKRFEVVGAQWRDGYERMLRHWVLADDEESARMLVVAALDASHVPRGAVLVQQGACWHRDQELHEAVERASWEEVVQPGDTVARLRDDVRSFLGSRELYARHQIPYKRGILLSGPPGNGKTLCVRALMKEANLPTIYVKGFEARYGEVEANIARAFERARRLSPSLLVLEDLDSLVKPAHLSVFLNELDGIRGDTGILTIATTNHPERLDPALLERPSRFDRKYHFGLPGRAERQVYLQRWLDRLAPEMGVRSGVAAELAEGSERFSFAALKELVVGSMLRWVHERERSTMSDVLLSELAHLEAHRSKLDGDRQAPSADSPSSER